jgi:hypothetical protein
VYKQGDISQIITPCWEEISIKVCWNIALQIPELMRYMPSNWDLENEGKKIQRSYFFGVFHTHSPAVMRGIIHNARKLRVKRAQDKKLEAPQA